MGRSLFQHFYSGFIVGFLCDFGDEFSVNDFSIFVNDHDCTGQSLFVVGALFFQYYKRLCKKQFGGITGDLAGYFLQVFELLMLGVIVLGTRLYALV